MRIRLIRKLSDAIDGVDISRHEVGDIIDAKPAEARLLIAEEWAVAVAELRHFSAPVELTEAADSVRRSAVGQLRRASALMERRGLELPRRRRLEDLFLEELRDSRAKTIP